MNIDNGGDQKRKESFDISRELYDWSEALVTSLVFVILVFALIVRIIGVEGSSMEPTLHDGDKVLLTNMFYEPQRGDVVVFTKKGLGLEELHRSPSSETGSHNNGDLREFIPYYQKVEDQPLVKRIIATEGETVDINMETGKVSVNGEVLEEDYIKDVIRIDPDMIFPAVVPEGCVFVMGDNRNNSLDSRSDKVGFIDKRYILGHVIARIYPFTNISLINS